MTDQAIVKKLIYLLCGVLNAWSCDKNYYGSDIVAEADDFFKELEETPYKDDIY